MLRTLVQLWKTWWPEPTGKGAAPRPATTTRVAAPVVARPPNTASATTPMVAIGARRPLIDAQGRVAGFEFQIAEATLKRLERQDGDAATTAHAHALFASMRMTAKAGRLAYTELPPGWLQRRSLAGEMIAGCMVALPRVDVATRLDPQACEAIKGLRAAGARVGWAGCRVQPLSPDFALVEDGLDDIVDAKRRGLPVLASDIESIEALDIALRAGATYACFAIAQRSEPKDAQPIAPQVARLCQLLNQIVQEADTAPIISNIKADVGLAYRLLHHLHMAGIGAGREIESIEQAVLVLGRNELYRWLSMLLIRFAAARPASGALQEMALARARLFELLAIDRNEPAPGSLFTLGLASMLGLLLNVELVDAIEPLNLPATARDALLTASGPWYPYLALAAELENPDSTSAEALAQPFGGLASVQQRTAEAWQWAAQVGEPPPNAVARA